MNAAPARRLRVRQLRVLLPVVLLFGGLAASVADYASCMDDCYASIWEETARVVQVELSELGGTTELFLRDGADDRARLEISLVGLDRDIATATIINPDGTVSASLRQAERAKPASPTLAGLAARVRAAGTDQLELDRSQDLVRGGVALDLANGAPPAASPVIVIERDLARQLHAASKQRRSHAINQALAFVAAASVLAVVLHLAFSRRLGRLAGAAQRFANGDLTARSGVSGRDEVGETAAQFDRMVDEIERSRTELARSAAEYRLLFVRHSLAMAIVDGRTARFLEVNDAALRQYGYEPDRFLTMTLADLNVGAVADDTGQYRAAGEPPQRHATADGELLWVQVSTHDIDYRERPAHLVVLADESRRVEAEAERARLNETLVDVAQAERRSLAADLHDGPVQQLIAAGMRLSRARARASEAEDPDVALAEDTVRATVAELRTVMFDLDPPSLTRGTLAEALEELFDQTHNDGDPEVTLAVSLTMEPPIHVRVAAYRAVREAWINIRKHADAATVGVHARQDGEDLVVEVRDDGRGFDPTQPAPSGHVGLVLARSRVSQLSGSMALHSAPGQGTRMVIRVPNPLAVPIRAGTAHAKEAVPATRG